MIILVICYTVLIVSPIRAVKTDCLLMPPGKANYGLTYHNVTGQPLRRSEPAKEKWLSQSCITIVVVYFCGYIVAYDHSC